MAELDVIKVRGVNLRTRAEDYIAAGDINEVSRYNSPSVCDVWVIRTRVLSGLSLDAATHFHGRLHNDGRVLC